MYNKWTINTDGYALWSYRFPYITNKNISECYLTVLKYILILGYETRFLILRESNVKRDFQDLLSHFLNFNENCHSTKGYFPSILSAYPSNSLKENNNMYFLNTAHWIHDEEGKIFEYEVNYMNIRGLLQKIKHKYNKARIIPLMHITSGVNKNLDGVITDIDFTFHLNSDLWAPKVPGMDFEREFTNEEIRKYGWDVRKKYWHSNLELAKLNVAILNEFMQKMLVFTKSNGGYCELDEGDLSIYEELLTDEGIVL